MQPGIKIIGISTFFLGFISGVYVFFLNNSGTPFEETPAAAGKSGGFEVIADMYGGCQMLGSCTAYRITQNGEYAYIQYEGPQNKETRYDGELSEDILVTLEAMAHAAELETLETSVFKGTCPVAFDGSAYAFQIFMDGKRYQLDTCVHEVSDETLIEELISYFMLFEDRHSIMVSVLSFL